MPTFTSRPLIVSLQAVMIGLSALCGASASAVTIWTDWASASLGPSGGGSGSGVVSGVGVTYSGELDGFVINGTSGIWAPASTFIGGTSTTSPSTVGDDLRLNGTFTGAIR